MRDPITRMKSAFSKTIKSNLIASDYDVHDGSGT